MQYFNYDKSAKNASLYMLLESLMERWEYEIVEFKEAKSQYPTDKIGRYVSAISNEANLKNQQYGWLIFGVSESKNKHVVGSNYKDTKSLDQFKYEISKSSTDGLTFLDIFELYPVVDGQEKRVVMFKIPAAVVGIPTAWLNRYYCRNGDNLDFLPQFKIDIIRGQMEQDWSRQVIAGSSIENLDKNAIALAREKYKDKKNKEHISKEVDAMTDEQFLEKIRLTSKGELTYAAMVLLGHEDYKYLIDRPPTVMWRLYSGSGKDRAYEIFEIPFIDVGDRLFTKIRNLTYKYMPNRHTLFPEFTTQYDQDMLYELLYNCIAHQQYKMGARIYLDEFEDKLKFTNPGTFIPEDVRNVLDPSYSPPFYKNQLLADTMANFGMIDTATMGIRRVYEILRNKYFPMPDYECDKEQVKVTVYGAVIDNKYTQLLYDYQDIDLEVVFLMDRVQKKQKISGGESRLLRKMKLVEGKVPNLYLSAGVSEILNEKEQYIKNKAFDDEYYKKLVVDYLKQWGKGQKKDFKKLLWDKLPDSLTDKQKEAKVINLLTALRKADVIARDSGNQRTANWVLFKNNN